MNIFIARQPILNEKKQTIAYELLFRDSPKNLFPAIDGNTATSKLLSNSFFSMGIKEITNNKPAFINFTKELILEETPLFFPKENIIIEILENIEPEENIIQQILKFKKKGYKIALDDFIFHEKYQPLIELCNIIKFDIISTPLEEIKSIVKKIQDNHPHIVLLAEKIETPQQFQIAREMGFKLFQGYFFAKPEILSQKDISPNKASVLKLFSEINKPILNTDKLINLIKNDVSISYKLLKFLNSAYFAIPYKINTIKDAVNFLGSVEIKKFIKIIAASEIADSKPPELLRQAIIRAKMFELIGEYITTDFSSDELFTIGIFSLMDAMLDIEMSNVLENINFSQRINNALTGKNELVNTIKLIIDSTEYAKWNECEKLTEKYKFLYQELDDIYVTSLKLADTFT